jgi:hypothetical protein
LLKTAIVVSSVIIYYNYTTEITGLHLLLVAVLSLSYYLLLTYFVERTLNYGIYSLIKKTFA